MLALSGLVPLSDNFYDQDCEETSGLGGVALNAHSSTIQGRRSQITQKVECERGESIHLPHCLTVDGSVTGRLPPEPSQAVPSSSKHH